MGRFNHSDYIELTMHFRCNLRCEHCMLEDLMDRLVPESMDRFNRTAPPLNSEVNRRRARLPSFVVVILDILSAYQIVSIKSGEAQS